MPRLEGLHDLKAFGYHTARFITSLLRSVYFCISIVFTFDDFEILGRLSLWRIRLLIKVCDELEARETEQLRADDEIAQERLSQVADHMSGGTGPSSKKGKAALLEKNPDDVSTIQRSLLMRVASTVASGQTYEPAS